MKPSLEIGGGFVCYGNETFSFMEIITREEIEGVLKTRSQQLVNKYLNQQTKQIVFNQKTINDSIALNYELQNIKFQNCEFNDSITFKSRTKSRSFIFSNCTFNGSIFINGGEFNNLHFENCKILNNVLNFSGGEFQTVRIERCRIGELNFLKGKFNELHVGAFHHDTIIDQVFINCSLVEGNLDFYRIISLEFDIRGVNRPDSSITISESVIRNFILCEFTNNGKMRIKRLSFDFSKVIVVDREAFQEFLERESAFNKYPYSAIFIQDSVLNNTELFSIDFTDFEKVFMRESSLINILISNLIWPEEVLHYPIPQNEGIDALREKSKKDYHLIRENYRQLKYACSKQGDVVGEQHFHGLEMNAYSKSLKYSSKILDVLVLKFSYWTSNYGQSLWRPLLVGILIIEGFFFWLLFLSGGTKFDSIDFTKGDNYIQTIAEFIRIINPLHKNDPELTGLPFIVDTIIRILSSYFIYNIIRATRRFIK